VSNRSVDPISHLSSRSLRSFAAILPLLKTRIYAAIEIPESAPDGMTPYKYTATIFR
jgi:hypothetical protein